MLGKRNAFVQFVDSISELKMLVVGGEFGDGDPLGEIGE